MASRPDFLVMVDILKIDKSFIQDLHTAQDVTAGLSLVDAIIAMAEGVERSAQLAYLLVKSCDQAQGHLFAEACDAGQIREYLSLGGLASRIHGDDTDANF